MESSLQERLKRLRERELARAKKPSAASSSGAGTTLGADHSAAGVAEDDIEALIAQARDEVSIDGQHGVTYGNDEDYEEDLEVSVESRTGNLPSDDESRETIAQPISRRELDEVTAEARKLALEAQHGLQDLSRDGHGPPKQKQKAGQLELEPREKPILTRASTGQDGSEDLQDELADALASEIGEGESTRPSLKNHELVAEPVRAGDREPDPSYAGQAKGEAREADELLSRLALLRAGERPTASQSSSSLLPQRSASMESESFTDPFNLPSAPKNDPIRSSRDGREEEKEDDWRARHDVQGRDLSAFEKLVRLDANKLGEPSSRSIGSKEGPLFKKQATNDNDEGDPDEWCCG